MTSNELSYVEDKLFLQTNLSTVLRPIVEEIYKKYNDVAFNKDFSDLQIYFTDNFVDACYYSLYSPKYLYKYLLEEHDKGNNKIYLNDDFDICICW